MARDPAALPLVKRAAAQPSDLEQVLARITPDVLALLQDGVGRSRREIVAALADRHTKEDVTRTLMRLAVTGRLIQVGSHYALAPASTHGGDD